MGLWILYAHTFIYICVDIGAIIYINLYVQDIIYMDILYIYIYIDCRQVNVWRLGMPRRRSLRDF